MKRKLKYWMGTFIANIARMGLFFFPASFVRLTGLYWETAGSVNLPGMVIYGVLCVIGGVLVLLVEIKPAKYFRETEAVS